MLSECKTLYSNTAKDGSLEICYVDEATADRWFRAVCAIPLNRPTFQRKSWQTNRNVRARRHVDFFGDCAAFTYLISETKFPARPMTQELNEMKQCINASFQQYYNACIVNLYENGWEAISAHRDAKEALGRNNMVATISLGQTRICRFSRQVGRDAETWERQLEPVLDIPCTHGSILFMNGTIQEELLHEILPAKDSCGPRYSITMREMKPSSTAQPVTHPSSCVEKYVPPHKRKTTNLFFPSSPP